MYWMDISRLTTAMLCISLVSSFAPETPPPQRPNTQRDYLRLNYPQYRSDCGSSQSAQTTTPPAISICVSAPITVSGE
ncbi:uncharacterized protein BO72DRAFT_13140 [Aspergillus fijiensis CBS 313.89]|uniref:Secreted protein n=1 Tax=Aspergillus fijiensis CBS 313.89 TaxID=1448319 RepID=A0A8G1W272_9EURO|nr:uncharacterized protein BO72DRAFT_13140 [Aspergillus fijiensis CBS 313.89]RAK80161.1 hypothetical protein BO72DRAFT_13140 [Aspergillus fijiensis CBS 313.89]